MTQEKQSIDEATLRDLVLALLINFAKDIRSMNVEEKIVCIKEVLGRLDDIKFRYEPDDVALDNFLKEVIHSTERDEEGRKFSKMDIPAE